MSDRDGYPALTGMGRRPPLPRVPGAAKPGVPPPADRPAGRHAAIKSKLPNLMSYRRWLESVRGDWENKR